MESLAESMPAQAAMPRFEDGSINLGELIRALAEDVVNAIMDAEADQLCAGGANGRNGYRERNLVTCVGDITMKMPKPRGGSFFPEDVAERYRRVDRAVAAAVAEMYASGTSTRKARRVAEKLGISRLSKDQVSAIARNLDEDVADLLGRDLGGSRTPYLRLDATYVRCRRGGRAASTAVVAAIGCDEDGWRRVPGLSVVDTESYDSWLGFLRAIKGRGARGVELVTSDAHKGLVKAIEEAFRGRFLTEMRRAPDARLHARGRAAGAQEAGRPHNVAGLPRQGRRRGEGNVPRRMRHAAGALSQGRRRGRGGRARRARPPGLPAVALEEAARTTSRSGPTER